MLKNEKGKFFLSVIVVLIIAGFLTWQGIVIINTNIDNSISDLKDKKISKNVYDLKVGTLEQGLEDYEFSKNKIEKINDYFVYASDNDDAEFTFFFGQLDSIAIQSTQNEKSLVIDLYQSKSNSAKDAKKINDPKDSLSAEADNEDSRLLKLTLKSDFEGLLKFISYLEAMPYYVYIESINTNIDGSSGAKKVLDKDTAASNFINLQTVLIIKVFRKTNIL